MYCIQQCFICSSSDSTVKEDAGIEPRTVATSAWRARRFNYLARSHPKLCQISFTTWLDLIHYGTASSLIREMS
jgi:hypothetical protein